MLPEIYLVHFLLKLDLTCLNFELLRCEPYFVMQLISQDHAVKCLEILFSRISGAFVKAS